MINSKSHKILGVINLTQTKNLDLVKGESKWTSTVLINSEYPSVADHFAFAFNTINSHDILNFTFSILDRKGDLIKFEAKERKVPVFSF